jgi:tRNA A-37 threonylcarbamoyl transferase component Bud32
MNTPPTLFAGILGGWELLIIGLVLGMLVLGLGALAVFAVWVNRKGKSTQAPATQGAASPTPPSPRPVQQTMRICKSCRAPLPPGAPEGLCPQCLLKVGLGSEAPASPGGPAAKTASEEPPFPADIAKHFPQLEILELLGQGGMGIVYKARQPHLDRFVAIKILSEESSRDPAFAERFQREAKALAKLNHPNIVAVYDFGQAGPYYFFLMEYVDGVNLAQLEHTRRLTPAEALALVPKVCDALQYAHDEGVVHRDIKPGNILLDKKGRVKIADFGLAKLLGKENPDFALTATGMVMGTPRYMAPEQMERPTEVDHRADIYSLGVVFYEMLTGDLPMGRFALPSQKVQIDVRLDEVVLRSLERDVTRRYQQASDVKTDVESISAGGPRAVAPDSAADDTQTALRLVQNPAIGLTIAGILYWIAIPFAFVIMMKADLNSVSAANIVLSLGFVPLVAGTLMVLGGQRMKRLESYSFTVAACILPLIFLAAKLVGLLAKTLAVGPGDWVGAPMGLWALVVLSRPEVRAAFLRNETAKPGEASLRVSAPPVRGTGKEATEAPINETVESASFFWPVAMGVLFLIWLIPAALWNLGRTGCLVALLLMGGVYAALTWWRVQTVPALAQAWARLDRTRQRTNLISVVGFAAAGYLFLLGALATRWESRPLNWNSFAATNEDFKASHQGQEFKLIRQLSAFREEVPAVELFSNGGSWTAGWNVLGVFATGGPHNRLFGWLSIACSLVAASVCLMAGVTCLSPPGKLRDTLGTMRLVSRNLALPLALTAIVGTLGAYVIMIFGQVNARSGPVEWINSPRVAVKLAPDQAVKVFEDWAQSQGYAIGDRVVFELDAVPKGEKLAEIRLGQSWKASPFDRWQMTWHGPQRFTPHLAVETISGGKPRETLVHIHVGWPPKDPLIHRDWKRLVEELAAAIRAAAPAPAAELTGAPNPTNVPGINANAVVKSAAEDRITFPAEGPQMNEALIQTLDLKPLEVREISRIIGEIQREYTDLEKKNLTLRWDKNGHLQVNLTAFNKERTALRDRLFKQLEPVLATRNFELAKRHLPVNQIMPYGTHPIRVELWQDAKTKMYFYDAKPIPEIGVVSGGSGSNVATLPQEYQELWRKADRLRQ